MRFTSNLLALVLGCALSVSLQPQAVAAGKSTVPGWQSAAGKTDEMVFVATGDSIINRQLRRNRRLCLRRTPSPGARPQRPSAVCFCGTFPRVAPGRR